MAFKKKRPQIEQHTTPTGHAATIEQKPTPYLLVPHKFVVRIYDPAEKSKVIHAKRTNCHPSALTLINSFTPPT